MFDLPDLQDAAALVHRVQAPTPQIAWPLLAEEIGTEVWLKHENHAPTGAFNYFKGKFPGAIDAVGHAAGPPADRPRGRGGWRDRAIAATLAGRGPALPRARDDHRSQVRIEPAVRALRGPGDPLGRRPGSGLEQQRGEFGRGQPARERFAVVVVASGREGFRQQFAWAHSMITVFFTWTPKLLPKYTPLRRSRRIA